MDHVLLELKECLQGPEEELLRSTANRPQPTLARGVLLHFGATAFRTMQELGVGIQGLGS